jgi:hypothetical protein
MAPCNSAMPFQRPQKPGRTRVVALAALAFLEAGAGGEESSSESASGSYVPTIGVLDDAGGARAGGSGNPGAHPEPATGPGRSVPMYVPDQDFPQWLGQTTGWWHPSPEPAVPQRRHMSLAPFITTSPLIDVGFGVAAAGTIQLGTPETTPLSTFATNILITTQSQFSVPLRTNINLSGGNWNLVGLWRFSKFPSPTWGLGGNTPDSARTTIDYSSVTFYETVSHRIVGDFFAGLGYYFDYFFDIADRGAANGPTVFTEYPYGTGSTSINSGVGLNFLFDNRDSPVNAHRGIYANFNYAFSPTWLGSTTSWHSFWLEGRTYLPLSQRIVLGLWAYTWFNLGNVPYLSLASIGSDPNARSGRGYVEGRHIGKSLIYGETELRYTIWQWFGIIAAINIHSAAEPNAHGIFVDEPRFHYWSPAVVVGARILVVKPTRSNLSVDFGWGKSGTKGIYVNFAEVF